MRRCLAQNIRLTSPLRRMLTARFFFLVICTSFAISYIWTQLVYVSEEAVTTNLIEEALENAAKDSRYSEVYRKPSKLPKELKYILLWTPNDYAPFYYFKSGQRAFIESNCSVINCYVTSDRRFFKGDLTKFDAIAFNGRNMRRGDLPKHRSPHQKYIFFNMESADNYPVCSDIFDGFFNWTSTYRLDSDIPYPYILIRNMQGTIVGPKTEMHWPDELPEVDDRLAERLMNKSKAAAWFVSHCSTKSGREKLVKKLQKVLALYGYNVDIYGSCGPLQCSRNQFNSCSSLLEKDYFFYMSMENSFADDYVTEKLLKALQHNAVPVVYGGANYSRFLPPGSYLDASKFNVYDLAAIMDRLMSAPKIYSQYFRWKSQYTYSDPSMTENVCAVCAALNDKKMMDKVTVYNEFREWWNPDFWKNCPW